MPFTATSRNTGITAITNDFNTIQFATDDTFSTILATITFAGFAAASNGTRVANPTSPVNVSASGNIEAFRIRNASNVVLVEETGANAVSGTGGGGIVVLNQADTAVVAGQTLSIDSFSVSLPA